MSQSSPQVAPGAVQQCIIPMLFFEVQSRPVRSCYHVLCNPECFKCSIAAAPLWEPGLLTVSKKHALSVRMLCNPHLALSQQQFSSFSNTVTPWLPPASITPGEITSISPQSQIFPKSCALQPFPGTFRGIIKFVCSSKEEITT